MTEHSTISESTDTVDTRYLESDRPVAERVEILLAQMTLEEKAGLLFHTMISMGEAGTLSEGDTDWDLPSTEEYVVARGMSHFNLLTGGSAEVMASWHNRLQELAASTRLGIPVTISSDPRHSYSDNPLAGLLAGSFSVWPEALGLAATRDAALVEGFGRIARQEYSAVGIRLALHPQVDLATEPRWARQLDTFGEDPALTSVLGAAYIRGFQGAELGADSVATMTKHFPGGGAQKDGEDPHFAYGREQVYPGGQFELHLKPFEAAFAAGTSQIMPYYGMPVGTEYEEVGFGFNQSIITGLLRGRFGFDGIVCTDWGLINDSEVEGEPFPARAWGVENLTPRERMIKVVQAGVDQFGGEADPAMLVEIVRSGDLEESRIDESVARLLREKFVLGLFDDRFVDVERASKVVGSAEYVAAGEAAQRASLTLLQNGRLGEVAPLPIPAGSRLYVEGIDAETAASYGTVVDDPAEADVAIIRLRAPFEERGTVFENYFHAGSLEFAPAVLAHLAALAAVVPVVVDVFLDRPALLGPVADTCSAVVANFGSSSRALLDVLTGGDEPRGSLPFEIPSSMAAVEASRSDVPFDTEEPRYRFGHGLRYTR